MIETPRHSLDSLFTPSARTATLPLFPHGSKDPGQISLTYGFADPTCFPYDELAEATRQVLAEEGPVALNYSDSSPELVDQVVARLRLQGVEAEPEQLLVTYGSSQVLGLLPQVFVEPGDTILVEAPTFVGAVRQFQRASAQIVGVPLDEQGMNIDALEATLRDLGRRGVRPKFIYTIPTFQNPTGATMPLERRRRLVALAAEYGVLVVEDDAYGELRFEGAELPTLAALDEEGWVLRVSTFSKTLAPGVRAGWAYGNPEIISRLAMFRSEGESGPLLTRVVARYCAGGRLEAHIAMLCDQYRSKRDAMLGALARELPQATALRPEGGFFVWLRLPEGVTASRLLPLAAQEGVEFLPGRACFADGSGDQFVRLAFSFEPTERLVEGIARLGRALRAA